MTARSWTLFPVSQSNNGRYARTCSCQRLSLSEFLLGRSSVSGDDSINRAHVNLHVRYSRFPASPAELLSVAVSGDGLPFLAFTREGENEFVSIKARSTIARPKVRETRADGTGFRSERMWTDYWQGLEEIRDAALEVLAHGEAPHQSTGDLSIR